MILHVGVCISTIAPVAEVLYQGQKDASFFHCLRATYVNRLRRAGVLREAARRLVNHASQLIHQIYQREKVDDVMQSRNAVRLPTSRNPPPPDPAAFTLAKLR